MNNYVAWGASAASLLVVLAGTAHLAGAADKSISGKDAAYIDWGVKNCEVASSRIFCAVR